MDLRALIARLNGLCRERLEAAAGLTMARTHYSVEIEHWLLKLADAPSDVALILAHFDVDAERLRYDLNRSLDRMAGGNGRAPALSPHLVQLVREAWLAASLERQAETVRSGELLLALLTHEDLSRQARDISSQLARIAPTALAESMQSICAASPETHGPSPAADPMAVEGGQGGQGGVPQAGGALDKYCLDLTKRAREGKIDPVLGRDGEIRQIVDVLTRRRQNNPILTGEAGVGKTAVVEGLALKVAAGDTPEVLRNVRLLSLDLGLLQAGAGVKGEFENRLKSVIQEVKSSPTPIIMFIDEAHTLIGAGGAEGQGDAANLLKPALARGEMRTIAATTWAEYKKYFEKDPALTRRFQVVKIDEPNETDAILMMRGLVDTLEAHHKVRILDEAVQASVRLSHRYISGRQLPDKAISLLDTACARVAMSQAATPAALEDLQRQLESLATQIRVLEREVAAGADHDRVLEKLRTDLDEAEARKAQLSTRLTSERELVAKMIALRDTAASAVEADALAQARQDIEATRRALADLQADAPMVFDLVDHQAVAQVVATWTGIPVGRMVADEINGVLDLAQRMGERIRGQPQALEAIARTMRSARAGLSDPRKPLGVFLMCGTSGVGKTETALTLADLIYGGAQSMTVINMSEFKEEHKVSMLLGSPPGYVGYGEGGVLTEAVRRKPFSVVLLDEVEKAHPGVQDIFYQVFDKGQLKDGQGRDIDFRNTIIIMTANAGSEVIEKLCADPETCPDTQGLVDALRPELLKTFKPAFLGRVTLVPYFPLSPEILRDIVVLTLGRLAQRLGDAYGASLSWNDELVSALAARCTETQSGARNVESIINQTILPDLATRILGGLADGKRPTTVSITSCPDGAFSYAVETISSK